MRWILFVLVMATPAGAEEFSTLVLPLHHSQTVRVVDLTRVAVADGKTIRVRTMSPHELLVTGLRLGVTTLRAWDNKQRQTVLEVRVISQALQDQLAGKTESVVKISLEFLEIDSSMSQGLGVRWPEAIQFSASATLQGGADFSGINYSAGFGSARGLITGLMKEGWAKMLANPELYVRLGEEAVFHSGGEIPVQSTSEDYGRYHPYVQWKPFGLTVKVKPQSADGLNIQSEIRVEISELNRGGSVEGIPGIVKRNLETKMSSRDRETVVLSGLVREISSREKSGIPLLGWIPVLGVFFSSKKTSQEATEVFMAITFSFTTRTERKETNREAREKFSNADEVD
jgi:type II secretory pathway component GspD/PulD (secretin)